MNKDFHYYATYCAAMIAGFSHEESLTICSGALFVDMCTRTYLEKIDGPGMAATTQLNLELANAHTDIFGLQDITRIWSSFHFLPRNLYAKKKKRSRLYMDRYRLICGPNGDLVVETVKLAKNKGLEAAGVAMHVLADTWAHQHFAGTPSLVINNTDDHFFELIQKDGNVYRKPIAFRHNPMAADDLDNDTYTNTVFQANERSVMNLGHGRAGHLPDYSFIRYKYLPAWNDYKEMIKDNQSDYLHAFAQMVYALGYLRGKYDEFLKNVYDWNGIEPYEETIRKLLSVRRTDDTEDWKALGEYLSGYEVRDFDQEGFQREYQEAPKEKKEETFFGRFILAALAQKSMVTNRIFQSGNLLAGYSVDFREKGFKGIKDFQMLIEAEKNRQWEKQDE